MARKKSGISKLKTVGTFMAGRGCADTLFHVINGEYGQPMTTEEKAAMPFAGGVVQHGYQCGMIWGTALAAGAQAYRLHGMSPLAETKTILAAQKAVESFRSLTGEINCLELTDIDHTSTTMQKIVYFLLKGGTIGCFRMSGRYAPIAFDAIDPVLSDKRIEAPPPPVSCAAVLAKKLGATGMQTVMAAGLAGGIGLCGGACGALGAAIWLSGTSAIKAGSGKIEFKSKKSLDLIDRFLKCTKYEFECSEIVGRKFESVADHAAHLRDGGCKEIIDTLAG